MKTFTHFFSRFFFILGMALILSVALSPVFAQPYEADFTSDEYDYSFYEAPEDNELLPNVSSRRFMFLPKNVDNVIYMVGDGMSYGQVAATRYQMLGPDDKLHFERLPVTANLYTHAADQLVTDSAAAATALATGYLTNSGMVGMLPDGEKTKSIMTAAAEQGRSRGLVVTSTATHATPAPFASHVENRGQQADIAVDYLDYGVEVIFGGGTQFFLPESHEDGARDDGRNLVEEFTEAGYSYASNRDELFELDSDKALGLFSYEGLQGTEEEPTLPEMTGKAIELLSRNKDGFFMHVEGSQIDWAGHANDPEWLYNEMLYFDMAVKEAIDFAREDGNTLVIVTADHETGGLTILHTESDAESLNLNWSTGAHSAVPVPLYAYGPYAEKFTGTMHMKDVPQIIADILNIDDFPKILEE